MNYYAYYVKSFVLHGASNNLWNRLKPNNFTNGVTWNHDLARGGNVREYKLISTGDLDRTRAQFRCSIWLWEGVSVNETEMSLVTSLMFKGFK